MSAIGETLAIFAGVDSLGALAIFGPRIRIGPPAGRAATTAAAPGRAPAPAGPAPAKAASGLAAVGLAAVPDARPGHAVARSSRNPGLAEFAAGRERGRNGRFLPIAGEAS
jgi:hypothetical protein